MAEKKQAEKPEVRKKTPAQEGKDNSENGLGLFGKAARGARKRDKMLRDL